MTTIWFAEERLRGELAGELQIFETIFQLQKFIALLRRVYGEWLTLEPWFSSETNGKI